MHVSDRMLAVIAEEEGVVLKAYRCPAGVLTIGIGHTSRAGAPRVRPGMIIDRARAFAILRDDLRRTFEPRVARALPGAAQTVFDGAASFDFNTGRIHNASWVPWFRAGNGTKAEASFKSWNKGGGRVLKGLVRRRRREADIIFRGDYGAVLGSVSGASVSRRSAVGNADAKAEDVTAYQTALAKLGFYRGEIDGLAGPLTRAAVKAFQKRHGLAVDGIVGPATRATLDRALNRRRANRTSAAGGVAAGGADAVIAPGQTASADPSLPQTLIDAGGPAVTLALAAIAIWGGFWIWRNRGHLFAWLPRTAKDFIEDRLGLVVGRRMSP